MKATEAHDEAQKQLDMMIWEELSEVRGEIKSAIGCGKFEAFYFKSLLPQSLQKLKDDGYTITEMPERNELHYKITW